MEEDGIDYLKYIEALHEIRTRINQLYNEGIVSEPGNETELDHGVKDIESIVDNVLKWVID